jgi:hypothetical protein
MVRQLGKVLALAAMAASLVNAQCAFSCSLQIAGPGAHLNAPVERKTSHLCCPQHTKKSDQSPDNSCPHHSSNGDEARLDASTPILALAPGLLLAALFDSAPLDIAPRLSGRVEGFATFDRPLTGAPVFATVRRI